MLVIQPERRSDCFSRELRDENSLLKRNDKKCCSREVITATGTPVYKGITRASLQIIYFSAAFPRDY
jgi:hypothetical protein